jgi:hypothetical protein
VSGYIGLLLTGLALLWHSPPVVASRFKARTAHSIDSNM